MHRVKSDHASRTQSTSEEPTTMIIQSMSFRLSTLKKRCMPGNSTIAICVKKMSAQMNSIPLQPLRCSALRCVWKARALKR